MCYILKLSIKEIFNCCSYQQYDSLITKSLFTLATPGTLPGTLPGSSVHEIFQARILKWVPISFSKGFSWTRDRTPVSCITDGLFTDWTTSEAGWVLKTTFSAAVSIIWGSIVFLILGNSGIFSDLLFTLWIFWTLSLFPFSLPLHYLYFTIHSYTLIFPNRNQGYRAEARQHDSLEKWMRTGWVRKYWEFLAECSFRIFYGFYYLCSYPFPIKNYNWNITVLCICIWI